MEILAYVVVIFGTFAVFLAGFVACSVVHWWIKREALRLNNEKASLKGVEAKQEQAERLMMFMTEVKAAYDKAQADGKDIKAFMAQDMPAIALKYPDILMKFGTRLQKMLAKNGFNFEGLAAA